jgi:hypothetical protein
MESNVVGGYRLVRCIGEGTRSTVHVGHPVGRTDDDGAVGSAAVALKVYRDDVATIDIAAEVEALARAAGPHVVEVLDVASTQGRPVLIMQRLGAHTLSGLFVARATLTSGEAVTILAPLAEALERCHRAGVAHGAVRAGAVGFTASGAPTLTGFGAATVFEPGLPEARRAEVPAVQFDRDAFARLAEDVLGRVPGAEPIRAWLSTASSGATWIQDLPGRLFAWSSASAVRFSEEHTEPILAPIEPVVRRELRTTRHAGLEAIVDRVSGQWRDRLGSLVASVRPRFWALGGATLLAIVTGVVVVSQPEADAQLPAAPAAAASPTPTHVLEDPQGAGAEDPAVALRALLEVRAGCIHDLSVLCLDAVAQPGSSALARDQQLVRDLQQGGEVPDEIVADEIVVEERLGGTALLTVTSSKSEPASILVMRSEAGWRIRDYLE